MFSSNLSFVVLFCACNFAISALATAVKIQSLYWEVSFLSPWKLQRILNVIMIHECWQTQLKFIERLSAAVLGNESKCLKKYGVFQLNYSSISVEFRIFWWNPFHYYVNDVWVEWNTKDSNKICEKQSIPSQTNHLLFYLHGCWAV